jgi:hypothetical protein
VADYLTRDELKTLLRKSLKYVLHGPTRVRIVTAAPADPPLVTVIIPTYNWSNALRLAIRSVLWQTEQNFRNPGNGGRLHGRFGTRAQPANPTDPIIR